MYNSVAFRMYNIYNVVQPLHLENIFLQLERKACSSYVVTSSFPLPTPPPVMDLRLLDISYKHNHNMWSCVSGLFHLVSPSVPYIVFFPPLCIVLIPFSFPFLHIFYFLSYSQRKFYCTTTTIQNILIHVNINNAGLKLNIKKTKIMASGPITLWHREGKSGSSDRFPLLGL